MILGLRFVAPKVPGALVLVVGGLLASALFDLGAHGVALVGDVPSGLPSPALPDADVFADHAATIGIAAVALLLIGFSQTAGDARAFAARHRYRVDVNQESIAQGMANAGAGLFQGMPVSTSLSASSLNESSGARTPMASLVTGALVLLTLVVLAPLFSDLPKAVLGALIIDAVVFGMIDVAGVAPPAPRRPGRLLDRGRGHRRRALGRRPRRRGDRRGALAGVAHPRRHRGRASRGSAGSRARRCSATQRATPRTRRSTG